MSDIPDRIHDALVAHSTDLLRYSAGLQRRIRAMLDRLRSELAADLADSGLDTPRTDWQRARLRQLEAAADRRIRGVFTEVADLHDQEMRGLIQVASDGVVSSINAELAVPLLQPIAWTAEQLSTIAGDALVEGAPSAGWWARQEVGVREAFADQMRMGMLRGETLPELTKRVAGLMDTAKHNAAALAHTSVISTANQAHLAVFQENDDIIKGIQWISTLDNKTTPICRALDGKQWTLDREPIGHSMAFPGPTAHWRCRSTQVPVTKSWEELATKNKALARKLDEAWTPGERASMGGPVSSDLTYEKWFKGLSQPKQEDILGPARFRLWEKGKLGFTDMVSGDGSPLTLDQLRRR